MTYAAEFVRLAIDLGALPDLYTCAGTVVVLSELWKFRILDVERVIRRCDGGAGTRDGDIFIRASLGW